MNRIFAPLQRFLAALGRPATASGLAHQLMERAGEHAGRNPQQARELRRAAFAYLSVVR